MKKRHKSFLALAAFAAASVFFGADVFGATISDWPLQAAWLRPIQGWLLLSASFPWGRSTDHARIVGRLG